MPGFILHMTASQMLFNKYDFNTHNSAIPFFNRDVEINRNSFEIGNLIPDSVSDKTWSHFRNPGRQEKLMVYPDLDLFLAKYEHLLTDSSCLGYYFHLFIDRVYAKDYIPQIVTFYNKNGQEASNRADITHAFIKRTQELVPIKTFFSDEYYYGDFTKLNTYLINRFHLTTDFNFAETNNPGIEEVDYNDITFIQEQLAGYLDVPERAVNELRVFEAEHLLSFLEKSVDKFIELLLK